MFYFSLSGDSPFRASTVEQTYTNIAYCRYDAHSLYDNITRDALRFIFRILKRVPRFVFQYYGAKWTYMYMWEWPFLFKSLSDLKWQDETRQSCLRTKELFLFGLHRQNAFWWFSHEFHMILVWIKWINFETKLTWNSYESYLHMNFTQTSLD